MALLNNKNVLPNLSRLEPLDGTNYKRWSQKLLIFFEQLEIDYVLFEDPPEVPAGDNVDPEAVTNATKKLENYEKYNKLVRGHLLAHMPNNLFDLFFMDKSAKGIWAKLEKKYGADDAGNRKYVTGKWLQFQMVDDKPITEQVHEYENLVADVVNEGMKMCEILQANVLIEKFPPSWSDFRNHLKHKKKDFTLQELISYMRTEEANRLKDKYHSAPQYFSNANLVESAGGSVRNRFNKGKKPMQNKWRDQKHDHKVHKKTLMCYVCGKTGHKAYQCPLRKDTNAKRDGQSSKPQANLAEDKEIIAAVVVEANLVNNITEWVLDTGATRHICATKELFQEFEEATDGDIVYMGNSATAGVCGKGKILLKLTSGKTLALSNVLFVPSMRRNLVSGALLNKAGLKIVLESDKIVITKNGDFVGKGYLNGGLFVLNTIEMNNNASGSIYIVESIDVWHDRLGHLNFASIKRLRTMDLLPHVSERNTSKCPICVEAKHTRKPFKTVSNRHTELLELIHSDLADFKSTVSRGGKKYYITFVDDYSRYTSIFLLKSKSETEAAFLIYKAEVEKQLDRYIKRLRSDRGGEYSTTSLKEFCEKKWHYS
jgi:hypothetical protein